MKILDWFGDCIMRLFGSKYYTVQCTFCCHRCSGWYNNDIFEFEKFVQPCNKCGIGKMRFV